MRPPDRCHCSFTGESLGSTIQPTGSSSRRRRKQQLAAARRQRRRRRRQPASASERDPSARRKSPLLLRAPSSAPTAPRAAPSPRAPPPPQSLALPGGGGQPGKEGGSPSLLPPAAAPLPRRPPALRDAGGERGASATRLLAGRRAGCGRRCRRGGREGGGRAAERRFLCAVPERGGIRRTGRRRGCDGRGAAATGGGGGGGAGSSRVPASQEWEASEAKMPLGSAAPLGRSGASTPPACRGSPVAQPAPSEPAMDARALPGALASAHQTCGTDESSAFQERWARGGVLSTRGRAMDGDACNLWLNWRSRWGLARTNVFVDNKNEFSRDQCKQGKPVIF
ncbi:translation initiation factor IF-2-like isoform X3 [Corvus kubaryi]|uniref:translation initiation factor IF-2-like isoform X3 n=1 Tax=Corvus kubaryi TaxID=68294 RepID=UPI001C04D2C1|nr:translation initiation factor IF-2-like isoform X3 [Corvus kubaryi]